jgi:hypothetical protein
MCITLIETGSRKLVHGGASVQLSPENQSAYREAYERWRRDLDAVHAVILDGEKLDPMHFVALLRRESKSKTKYDEARERLLGLPGGDEDDPFGDSN